MNGQDYRLMVGKMNALGFRETHNGTFYIRQAVEEFERGMYMTKDLYPGLAKRFGTTPAAVERAMRYAVKEAACRCRLDDRRRFFGCEDPDKAQVGEFIKCMQVYLEYGV